LPQDLDGDMGAGWRLRMASENSARKFLIMLILSFSYFCAEMTFGVMSGSLAVLADAFHMLTDVAALVCGYWVAQLSMKKKSSTNSFGWKRAEIVGALCNGFVFFVIGSLLLFLPVPLLRAAPSCARRRRVRGRHPKSSATQGRTVARDLAPKLPRAHPMRTIVLLTVQEGV